MKKFNCYIIHWPALNTRRDYLEQEIIPILRQSPHIKDVIYINQHNQESQEIKDLKEYEESEGRPMNLVIDPSKILGVYSCARKHYAAWDLFLESGDDHCLILEDDIIFNNKETFLHEFNIMVNRIEPKHNHISFGKGCGFEVKGVDHGFHEKESGRCADSYIINKNWLEIYKKEGKKYNVPIDHIINFYFEQYKEICYWYSPELVFQGSQKGGAHHLYASSLGNWDHFF